MATFWTQTVVKRAQQFIITSVERGRDIGGDWKMRRGKRGVRGHAGMRGED